LVSHQKITNLLSIPRWLTNGPDPDEAVAYHDFMNGDYEQKLLKQHLPNDKLIYLLSEDASKQADLKIDHIFGVVPKTIADGKISEDDALARYHAQVLQSLGIGSN
jgi:hypothetical protein